ncbi:xylan glycosyltransferase MUCI21-like [Rhodamnia argentea]|uniref:Xylan glycosyltransferase MUCI21-like n=1 Tax=Rhodamnia argentea TaxID=178133 RepID=A0A8B8QQK0_9MYRT|nr:xylan glycosyltransferase MUCI21-like [Rhodamnia argentea]
MRRTRAIAVTCLGLLVMILALDINLTSFMDLTGIQGLKAWARVPGATKPRTSASLSSDIHGSPITCDRSHASYDLCTIHGPALLDPAPATISPLDRASPPHAPVKTGPYTRKRDLRALSRVKELTITSSSPPPNATCGATQAAPALVFSAGGYTGNFFHEFSDGLVPLFITVESMFPASNVTLAVVDCRDGWLRKYADVLSHLSRRPVINLDRQEETLCFPSITVALITHAPMTIDPKLLPHPKSLRYLASFLEGVYGGGRAVAPPPSPASGGRPRPVLVSRPRSAGRAFLNQAELEALAERTGFEVRGFAPTHEVRLAESYRLVQESHAMTGVHGAAMTHAVFLRRGSVLLQVVPVGTAWLSEAYFGRPARVLGLEYVEYRIGANESSLAEQYGVDSLAMKDPRAVVGGGVEEDGFVLEVAECEVGLGEVEVVLREGLRQGQGVHGGWRVELALKHAIESRRRICCVTSSLCLVPLHRMSRWDQENSGVDRSSG